MRMIRRGWFGGVLLALVFVPTLSVGAQTQAGLARFAPVAPSERIPNLDTLKDELKQYHACTCTCGCYATDLDLQADRAIAFLRLRRRGGPETREACAGARYR